jgi:DNA-binding MarR family transcriptional regulator
MEDWSSRRDLILVALLEGPKSPRELAEVTGMRRPEVEMVLVSLRAAGLVVEEEVKGLLRRKTVYRLTEEGIREAQEARKRLERVAEEIRQRAGEGDVEGIRGAADKLCALPAVAAQPSPDRPRPAPEPRRIS